MPIITTSAGVIAGLIASGLLSAGASAGMTAWNQKFNREEAQKNRDFQKEMRDTSLISTINQAKEIGISPSLVLNQGNNAIGGSQASVGGAGANPLANTANRLLDIIEQDRKLDTIEKIQGETLEHKSIDRLSNTANKKPFTISKKEAEKISQNYFNLKEKGRNFN